MIPGGPRPTRRRRTLGRADGAGRRFTRHRDPDARNELYLDGSDPGVDIVNRSTNGGAQRPVYNFGRRPRILELLKVVASSGNYEGRHYRGSWEGGW